MRGLSRAPSHAGEDAAEGLLPLLSLLLLLLETDEPADPNLVSFLSMFHMALRPDLCLEEGRVGRAGPGPITGGLKKLPLAKEPPGARELL